MMSDPRAPLSKAAEDAPRPQPTNAASNAQRRRSKMVDEWLRSRNQPERSGTAVPTNYNRPFDCKADSDRDEMSADRPRPIRAEDVGSVSDRMKVEPPKQASTPSM